MIQPKSQINVQEKSRWYNYILLMFPYILFVEFLLGTNGSLFAFLHLKRLPSLKKLFKSKIKI